ncbi:hypothetical protein K3F44_23215 [Pseudomonas sp. S07E 245]|uniref:hypothetical protein n=1 Tax=Pseudomonas sp. S07E 245 TaxID=2866278 RepID=UPI001C735F5D|nr:hypothetical protein [Pseudomonas sp. S07E 245]QYX52475.1 hypothetical protein K3F44_23215 [Pseudomonas sp. S07E 245]
MTFRVEVVHDLIYACPTGHLTPDHLTDLDHRTWTCRNCRQSVFITMGTAQGQRYTVERVPAQNVRLGDYLVCRIHADHAALQVTHSAEHTTKPGYQYLRIEAHGPLSVTRAQYLNCIRG